MRYLSEPISEPISRAAVRHLLAPRLHIQRRLLIPFDSAARASAGFTLGIDIPFLEPSAWKSLRIVTGYHALL